jgi:TetR/AcrR family transcriptional repressor of lmrAB and yxaGH operons
LSGIRTTTVSEAKAQSETKSPRLAIIGAAARLFRRRGYAGVGINEIVAACGAPKGSVYHYFPGGKAQIGLGAVELGGRVASKTLTSLLGADSDPAEAARLYGARMADWMSLSSFRDGCPIATVVLEMAPQNGAIATAASQAFDDWRAAFAKALEGKGLDPERAAGLALLAVTSIEGALILARAKASTEPILQASEAIAQAFEAALLAV